MKILCRSCGHTSPDNWKAKRHARSHMRDRPYKCTVCDKQLATYITLRKHVKLLHIDNKKIRVNRKILEPYWNTDIVETKALPDYN